MKKFAVRASALAALAFAVPLQAMAILNLDPLDLIFKIEDIEYEPLNQCYLRKEMSARCGKNAERFVCSVNAVSAIVERQGQGRSFARELALLYEDLSIFSGYLNGLMDRELMQNPSKMGSSQQIGHCREVAAAVQR